MSASGPFNAGVQGEARGAAISQVQPLGSCSAASGGAVAISPSRSRHQLPEDPGPAAREEPDDPGKGRRGEPSADGEWLRAEEPVEGDRPRREDPDPKRAVEVQP